MGTEETQRQIADWGGGRRWSFGKAVLDERTLELHVDAEHVPVERKPLEVLLYLLHHAGEVVTKDDLAENLWTGRILTETVLTRCISLLRQALKDDDRSVIRTVHGFGYRLVADVRVEASAAAPTPPSFDFNVGDHPPLRPQWKLAERLGTGGHGEAWLARHEKTGDARVFKFALDAGALSSLKREITLYRLLHDSLGATAAIARIYEWNLSEPPYFIEMEHVAGGNLQLWCEAQGGLPGIPLPTRLELVAQIADSLAAAHSVGALHKDLKPGNVLVHMNGGKPAIRLCDFGSGGVIDPGRLDALGITRHGFTKPLSGDATSATPLYVAPEVIAGQPFTVQADIYSLGILLYQMVAGDLRKPLAPGWEADVADELLREDIALAAAGNPAKRLTDAAQLAERLRTLESRRETRLAEVAARQRTERARRAMQELRRIRIYAAALLGLTAVAIAGGVTAYRARNEAVAATATAEAISGFLMEDVLRVDSGLFRPAERSYEAMLDRAAAEVGGRLREQPQAAANIHWLLGRRYQGIGHFDMASRQYEEATALFAALEGAASDSTLMAMDRLAFAYIETGKVSEALDITRELRARWESRLQVNDLAMLLVRSRIARTLMASGDYAAAEDELRAVLSANPSTSTSTSITNELFREWLGIVPPSDTAAPLLLSSYASLLLAGNILEERGEGYEETERRLRDSLAVFTRILGDHAELSALTHMALAVVLASRGNYEEAEQFAKQVQDFTAKSLPEKHFARGFSAMVLGRVRLEQRRADQALPLFQEAVNLCTDNSGCPPRVRAEFLWDLGRTWDALNRHREAIETLRASLAMQERFSGLAHPYSLRARISLAESLRRAHKLDEALAALSSINPKVLSALRPFQATKGEFRRVQGLILLEREDLEGARAALTESLEITSHRMGANHWRTIRARTELARALTN